MSKNWSEPTPVWTLCVQVEKDMLSMSKGGNKGSAKANGLKCAAITLNRPLVQI